MKLKSKDLIRLLNKFSEDTEINVFLLDTGKRIKLEYEDIEIMDSKRIDINIHA